MSVCGLMAQYDDIDENYYSFPIQPERTNYLSGSMGELRASHFHAGLDIKTNGREGLAVHAAADGYVSRIRVSAGGYGNCIYIAHPNGTTTVYAHLKEFDEVLARYVLENQYSNKSFEINLFPARNQFAFKKGEVIGLSGNTGSSGGPHLHFEIRNAKQEVLDPLRFKFDEIKDKIAPIPQRVAFKTMDIDSRINGKFGRFEFNLQRRGNEYILPDTIEAFGHIGVELWAHDKLDGAPNRNGIPVTVMKENGKTLFQQEIEKLSFSLQKNILIHTNYQATQETRRRYFKLYVDDGNSLGFYGHESQKGLLQVSDTSRHAMEINLVDSYGNQRNIFFQLKGAAPSQTTEVTINPYDKPHVQDNTLMLFDKKSSDNKIRIATPDGTQEVEAAYTDGKTNVFLWDLKSALPMEVAYQDKKEELYFGDLVPAASEHSFLSDTYSLKFGKRSLFDTLYIQSRHSIDRETGWEILEINKDVIPMKGSAEAEIQPLLEYDSLEKYHVYQVNDSRYPSFVGGEWEGEKIHFGFSSFGRFTLLKDDQAPTIEYKPLKENVVSFIIKDDLSGIKSFSATLNGKWLLMNYERKKNLIWSERLDKSKPLTGEFALTVIDNAGNEQIFKLKL
jgi:hypothetical protein